MPSTLPGRELVKEYLKKNDIKSTDLAKMYGMTKQEVSDYLSGRKSNPAANQFIQKGKVNGNIKSYRSRNHR